MIMKKIFLILTLVFIVCTINAQTIQRFYKNGDNIIVDYNDTITATLTIAQLNTSGEYDNFYNMLDNYTESHVVTNFIYQIAIPAYKTVDRLVLQAENVYIVGITETAPSSPTKLSSGDLTKCNTFINKIKNEL